MKISPMDIQRQTFGQRFRGLDPDEVRAYLNIVAEEVAALQMERDRLDQELQSLRSLIDEHRNRETILKNTLLTAQRVSEEIRDNARKEAETTVKEAEMQPVRLHLRFLHRRLRLLARVVADLFGHALGGEEGVLQDGFAVAMLVDEGAQGLELLVEAISLHLQGRDLLGHDVEVGAHLVRIQPAEALAEGLPLDVHGRDFHGLAGT